MIDRLFDADLDRLEAQMVKRRDGRGNTPDVKDTLRLIAEVRASRKRETAAVMEFDAVTRVEVIDTGQRSYMNRFTEPGATIAVQDDARTLKVFIDTAEAVTGDEA